MLAALSVVAALLGGALFIDAETTDHTFAKAEPDQTKAEYIVQHPNSQPPTL